MRTGVKQAWGKWSTLRYRRGGGKYVFTLPGLLSMVHYLWAQGSGGCICKGRGREGGREGGRERPFIEGNAAVVKVVG